MLDELVGKFLTKLITVDAFSSAASFPSLQWGHSATFLIKANLILEDFLLQANCDISRAYPRALKH
eukprot:snap_masked-scaffold_30-processed-gene-1.22-mRNA-1 protein AED:1.00 eAED:1.00 QI:0/0/0/0/1/1/2/0/65